MALAGSGSLSSARGARCICSCDWDKHAQITYAANFGETPDGDIHDVAVADIPKFSILLN